VPRHDDDVDAFEDTLLQACVAPLEQMDAALDAALEQMDAALDADSEHVSRLATLVQLQSLAATAVTSEHKEAGSTSSKKLQGHKAEAKEDNVEPAGLHVSKACFSNTLTSKLTDTEEDNGSLRVQLGPASKQLKSVSAAKALDFDHLGFDDAEDFERECSFETFLSHDSTDDSTYATFASEICTQELHRDTEDSLQQERLALNVDRAPMQQAQQDAPYVDVCIIAQEENKRLRDKFEEARMDWHQARSRLTVQHIEESVALQEQRDPLCNALQVEATHVAMEHVEPTGEDLSNRSLSKILKHKLTNAEEENERLQQELDALSKKFQALRSVSSNLVL